MPPLSARSWKRLGSSSLLFALLAAAVAVWAGGGPLADAAAATQGGFERAFTAGSRDASGRFMGGTELRVLTAHAGKLFAGNGYWMDQSGSEGPQSAEILVLDRPGGRWRVDYAFGGETYDGRARNLAVAALAEANFATDASGAPLAAPVSMLMASTWDLSGEQRIYTRDDSTGAWSSARLAYDREGPGEGHLPWVRAFGVHHDRVTGVDMVFAGHEPRGVFSGAYDPGVAGRIRWGRTPEFNLESMPESQFPGLKAHPRITSFADCNGRLYAAVGQQVYERIDGANASWRLVYTNPEPGYSQSGLRGLTAIADPASGGEVLLAAVEGSDGRIVRIDPRNGNEATDLNLSDFLSRAWGMEVGYTIAAYNDMAKVRDSRGQDLLLIGVEANIRGESPIAAGHSVVQGNRGQHESGAWYLIRHADGRYDVRQVPSSRGQAMLSTRTIVASPFPNDGDAIYFGGYDANKMPSHNTAWVVRASLAAALGASR
ncbi:MAG: hypothetical protein ACLQE9_13695 [Roseiarcus sp.]